MHCTKHPFELARDVCGHCAGPACAGCLTYPRGPRHDGLCVTCALARTGVRAVRVPRASGREVKRRREQLRARLAAAPPAERVLAALDLPGDPPPATPLTPATPVMPPP